jgi:hypothetical protein
MITTVEEFVRLRISEISDEYHRAAYEEAPIDVWLDVIKRFPEMRFWVAQNKTVSIDILEILSEDTDWRVHSMVASKRKLPEYLQIKLATDTHSGVRRNIAFHPKATKKSLNAIE